MKMGKLKVIKLYKGIAPGTEKVRGCEKYQVNYREDGSKKVTISRVLLPELLYFPASEEEDFIAEKSVIIVPGGAFCREVMDREGINTAKWFNKRGVTAFVLKYRLPTENHKARYDVAVLDILRAIKLVRANSVKYKIDPRGVGIIGFSAGGFYCAIAAAWYEKKFKSYMYEGDSIDRINAKPAFCVLGYPAIAGRYEVIAMAPKIFAKKNRHGRMLADGIKNNSCLSQVDFWSALQLFVRFPLKIVHSDMPPIYICETTDDATTIPENSISYYKALRRKRVSAELHIYKDGGHGYGMGIKTGGAARNWGEIMIEWIRKL